MTGPPAFMIVGTPRSGTTLVQRLACEIRGVQVPPETHFFTQYVPGLVQRRTFPLEAAALADELDGYAALETSRDLSLDRDAVIAELGGRCDSPTALFGAIVRALAPGAAVLGEKTPDHLRWWRALAGSMPDLRLVAVIRDPRAVVASNRKTPWGRHPHGFLAEAWRLDAHEVEGLRDELPPARRLVLRYEDVVAAPDETRRAIAELLDIPYAAAEPLDADPVGALYQEREWWKEKVREPVTARWVEEWRSDLSDAEARDIELICREEMERFGYRVDGEGAGAMRPELEEQCAAWRFWLAEQRAEIAAYEQRFMTRPRT